MSEVGMVDMVDAGARMAELRRTLEGVGYVFVDERGDVSEQPVAWSFDQYVKRVAEEASDGGMACMVDAMLEYIKNAEAVKLAAARLVGSGLVNGADFVATDLVQALDSSVSLPVEMAIELARDGMRWIPIKEGAPSKERFTEPLRPTKARGDVAVRRGEDNSVVLDVPASLRHGTFLDVVDALDQEGLTYCLVAASDRGFARGRSWALEVDGGGTQVLLDLGEDGRWSAMGTVAV